MINLDPEYYRTRRAALETCLGKARELRPLVHSVGYRVEEFNAYLAKLESEVGCYDRISRALDSSLVRRLRGNPRDLLSPEDLQILQMIETSLEQERIECDANLQAAGITDPNERALYIEYPPLWHSRTLDLLKKGYEEAQAKDQQSRGQSA